MRRTALIAALLLVGCDRGQDARPAAAGDLDPRVAAFAALEREGSDPFGLRWEGATDIRLARTLRPETFDGVTHARVAIEKLHRSDGGYVVEWLRADGPRVVCTARQVDVDLWRLDPPQPLLVAPLTVGQTWRWEGTAGGVPASADFRVRHVGERPSPDGPPWEVVEVEQVTRAAGAESRRVSVWARGLGLVAEEGEVPTFQGRMKYEAIPPRTGEW